MSGKPSYKQLQQRVKELETKLSENTERFNEIYCNVSEFIYGHDLEGNFTEINQKFMDQLGYSREELIGNNVRKIIAGPQVNHLEEYLRRIVENGKDEGLIQLLSKDGAQHIVEYKNIVVNTTEGPTVIRGIARDVTEHLETEQALLESDMRFRAILESIEDGYYEVDLEGNMVFFNSRVSENMGCSEEELVGINYREYMDEENAGIIFQTFHDVFMTGSAVKSIEWELIKKDGFKMFVDASVNLKKNREGEPVGFQGIIRDITDRKSFEQELAYLAYHDTLTGLYNRKAFVEKLDETLKHAMRYEEKRTILYLDLDKFKKVNDIYGHETGDKLLADVASRLKNVLRETDYISRLGGDEFTIILGNHCELPARKVAQRIVKRLSMPYNIQDVTIDFVTPSIGISFYPEDGHDVETLLKHADDAMYTAKEKGNRYVCYCDVPADVPSSQARQG